MPANPPRLTKAESRLLAILEADGGWMDRYMIAYRCPGRVLSTYHGTLLHHLVERGLVEVER